jgi:hypothetical protein
MDEVAADDTDIVVRRVPEHVLDGRADVADLPVLPDDGDDVVGVLHQGAEALLGAGPLSRFPLARGGFPFTGGGFPFAGRGDLADDPDGQHDADEVDRADQQGGPQRQVARHPAQRDTRQAEGAGGDGERGDRYPDAEV